MYLVRAFAGAVLLAALGLQSAGGLTGQEKDKKGLEPEAKPAKGVPVHWDKLELTDAQRGELAKLYADYLPKRQKLQDEMNKLAADLARKRVAVLTDDQRKKLVEVVTADPPKEQPAEKEKADPPREKPKPKGNPDK